MDWGVDAVCEHLEAQADFQIKNLVINIHPRRMKSLNVCVFWPAWVWITRPERQFIFTSHDSNLSMRDSGNMRDLILSAWYQQRWGDRYQLADDQNEKKFFKNTERGHRLATSMDGAGTGQNADHVVADDPHDTKKVDSEAKRTSVIENWKRKFSTRTNHPELNTKTIVMQRVHDKDLAGEMLGTGEYEHLVIPYEYSSRFYADMGKREDGTVQAKATGTSLGWPHGESRIPGRKRCNDPRTEEGQLINEERHPRSFYESMAKTMGRWAFAAQYGQDAVPRGGGLFRTDYFCHWCKIPPQLTWAPRSVMLPKQLDMLIASWDCAFKDLLENDFVAGGVWGITWNPMRFYLLDVVRRQMGASETIKAMLQMRKKWPQISAFLVEDKANGPAVANILRRKIPGLLLVNPLGGKEARANACEPLFEAHNVYVPSPGLYPWVDSYKTELERFPKGSYDDQVDMTTQALLYALRRTRGASLITVESVVVAKRER